MELAIEIVKLTTALAGLAVAMAAAVREVWSRLRRNGKNDQKR